MPVYTASSIIASMPILASFMAFFIQGEPITLFDILGLLCSFGGVLLINDPFKFFT